MNHPTTERGRDVRHRLMAAATELIPELGWEAVSTRLVAEQAGVTPGLVHYHFASLTALLRAAALAAMRELGATMEDVFADDPDPATGLSRLLGMLDAYAGDDPISLLFVETYLASTRELELQRELRELVAELITPIARWLAANDVPEPEATATVITSAIDGLMLHRALNPSLTAATVEPVLSRLVLR